MIITIYDIDNNKNNNDDNNIDNCYPSLAGPPTGPIFSLWLIMCCYIILLLFCFAPPPHYAKGEPILQLMGEDKFDWIKPIYVDISFMVTYLPYSTSSETDLGLCLAVFAGSGRKYLFHRIG